MYKLTSFTDFESNTHLPTEILVKECIDIILNHSLVANNQQLKQFIKLVSYLYTSILESSSWRDIEDVFVIIMRGIIFDKLSESNVVYLANVANFGYNYLFNQNYFNNINQDYIDLANVKKNLAGLVATIGYLLYSKTKLEDFVKEKLQETEEEKLKVMCIFGNLTWRLAEIYLEKSGKDRFSRPDFKKTIDTLLENPKSEVFLKDLGQIKTMAITLLFFNENFGFGDIGKLKQENLQNLDEVVDKIFMKSKDNPDDDFGVENAKEKMKELKLYIDNLLKTGGASNKIYILGQYRKLFKEGRKSYIKYKGEHISLLEARKLEKRSKK